MKPALYLLYWTFYVFLFSLIQGFAARDFLTSFYNELLSLLPKVLFVFIIIEWLVNALFFKKKIALFILSYISLLVLFALLLRMIDNYLILTYVLTKWSREPIFSIPPFLYNIIKLQFVITIPVAAKLFYYWSKEQNRVQVIKAEKLQAELHSLRNQFHPHFMFNVLNSLYSKILSGSGDAGDMVLRISSLLRFSVYEAKDKMIPLSKELDYITDYISLQQIRFDEQVDVSFTVTGIIEDKLIEPFLMLPFIENSFKYCTSDHKENGFITIFISVHGDFLTFKIENSLPLKIKQSHPASINNGTGIVNVRKRLELLYPENHVFKIIENEDSFFVLLKIKLHAAA